MPRPPNSHALQTRFARSALLGAAFALRSALLLACEGAGPTPPGIETTREDQAPPGASARSGRLIILISIDTLRADHLSLYGYPRLTSPNLDLFALDGAAFEDASSVSPWTLPAHASMLTGLHPLAHQVTRPGRKLPQEIPTVAKLLGERGWRTAAAVNSSWLLRKPHELRRDFEEFYYVQEVLNQRFPTLGVTDKAMEWIAQANADGADLLLFMHYYDVHSDYNSLPQHEKLFVVPYEGPVDGTTWQLNLASLPEAYIESCRTDFDGERCRFGDGDAARYVDESVTQLDFTAQDLRHLEALYDGGIRQLDAELGRFFRVLEDEGVLDRAHVINTSDHGEEFSDHGAFYHLMTTYQEVLRVPLIIRGPGVRQKQRIAAPVSLVDIAPTILSWGGVGAPESFEGLDLGPILDGGPEEKRHRELHARLHGRFQHAEASGGLQWQKRAKGMFPVFSSIRKGNFKLVHQESPERVALYDLEADPSEKTDLSASKPEVVHILLSEMERRRGQFESDSVPDNQIELDPEEAERLRALGYIID